MTVRYDPYSYGFAKDKRRLRRTERTRYISVTKTPTRSQDDRTTNGITTDLESAYSAPQELWALVLFLGSLLFGAILYGWLSRSPVYSETGTLNSQGCGKGVKYLNAVSGRVINGRPAKGAFPWTVIVYATPKHRGTIRGTGALITRVHVLTAAHVVPLEKGVKEVYVRYGSSFVSQMSFVKAIGARDAGFVFENNKNDILVLLLAEPLDDVPTLCVPPIAGFHPDGGTTLGFNDSSLEFRYHPDDLPDVGDEIVVAGFGITQAAKSIRETTELHYTTGIVLPMFKCPYKTRAVTEFCAQRLDTGICRGDSGASAMLKVGDRLMSVGVVSSTKRCGRSPDRYIRVSGYIEWLYDAVNRTPSSFVTLL